MITDVLSTYYILDTLPGALGALFHLILTSLQIAYTDLHFVADENQGHRGCILLWLLKSLHEVWTQEFDLFPPLQISLWV